MIYRFDFVYLFNGMSTPYELFNAKQFLYIFIVMFDYNDNRIFNVPLFKNLFACSSKVSSILI